MSAFSKLKPSQKSLVKIPHLLIKDHKERAAQEAHTVVIQSHEGCRVGRLLLFSGHCKIEWQPYLPSVVSGGVLGCILANRLLSIRKG